MMFQFFNGYFFLDFLIVEGFLYEEFDFFLCEIYYFRQKGIGEVYINILYMLRCFSMNDSKGRNFLQ